MSQVDTAKPAEPQAVVIDERLNVYHRLNQLRAWQQQWQQQDELLWQRIKQLDENNCLDIQKGVQIAGMRRRIRLNLVREPIEITPGLLEKVSYLDLRGSLVQQFVRLTDDERRLWLNNLLFIMTPDLRQLNDKIEKVRDYRSFGQQRNFLLGGESGMGKTTYLNWLIAQLIPTVEKEHNRVPIIKIDAPESSNRTPKPLLQRIILECGLNYVKGDYEEDLLMKLVLYFQKCQVELLMVDEVEHIRRDDMRRRLLEVSNLTPGVPIVCASCHPWQWVEGDLEIAGRWNDYFELKQYTGDRLSQLLAFVELLLPFPQSSSLALFEIQVEKGEQGAGPAQLIEKWTGGILRDIMLLVLDASRQAIKQGLPHLSVDLLAATWTDIQSRQVTDFLRLSQYKGDLP